MKKIHLLMVTALVIITGLLLAAHKIDLIGILKRMHGG